MNAQLFVDGVSIPGDPISLIKVYIIAQDVVRDGGYQLVNVDTNSDSEDGIYSVFITPTTRLAFYVKNARDIPEDLRTAFQENVSMLWDSLPD